MHVSTIGPAARLPGVFLYTLRRWQREGFLIPRFRTAGQERRYVLETLERIFSSDVMTGAVGRKALAYGRVSTSDKLYDLETQKQKLAGFCQEMFTRCEFISDVSSGLNSKKASLNKLMASQLRREASLLVLNHKDRLLRFGSEVFSSKPYGRRSHQNRKKLAA